MNRLKTPAALAAVAAASIAFAACGSGSKPVPARHAAAARPSPAAPLPGVPTAVPGKPLTYGAELPHAMGGTYGVQRNIQVTISKVAQRESAGGYKARRGRIYGFEATLKNVSGGQATDIAQWYWLGNDGNRTDLSTPTVGTGLFGTDSSGVAQAMGLTGDDLTMGAMAELAPGQHTSGYYLFDLPETPGALVHATYEGKDLYKIIVGAYRPPALAQGHMHKIGETAQSGEFQFKVTSVRKTARLSDQFPMGAKTAESGSVFLLIGMSVTNAGHQPQQTAGDDKSLVDMRGNTYTLDEDDTYLSSDPGSPVQPGITFQEIMVFQMPSSATPKTLQITGTGYDDQGNVVSGSDAAPVYFGLGN